MADYQARGLKCPACGVGFIPKPVKLREKETPESRAKIIVLDVVLWLLGLATTGVFWSLNLQPLVLIMVVVLALTAVIGLIKFVAWLIK